MAIALVLAASFDATFNAAGDAVSNAFDATGADWMAVFVSWRGSSSHTMPDNAVTFNGDACANFDSGVIGTTTVGQMRAYARSSPDQGSFNVTVDPSSGVGDDTTVTISVYAFSGVDVGATPFDGYQAATGTVSPATVTVTSATGDLVLFHCAARVSSPTSITPTDYTEHVDDNISTSGTFMCSGGSQAGAATVSPSGAISAGILNGWAAMGLNLNAAAAVETPILSDRAHTPIHQTMVAM